MSEKKETTFSRLLHSKLSPEIYVEKMSNPYRRGIPDFYYESQGSILWAEHKWIEAPWNKDRKAKDICGTKSWPLQEKWLKRAYDNGKEVRVIVGIGIGKDTKAYILRYPFDFAFGKHKVLKVEAVAMLIESVVR